ADDKPTAPGLPRDGFLPKELRAMEATAAAFMKKHDVPGLSVAIARKGRLVYADRVARGSQPWAGGCNPFGIGAARSSCVEAALFPFRRRQGIRCRRRLLLQDSAGIGRAIL